MYILYDKSGNHYCIHADGCRTPYENQPNIIEFYNGWSKNYEVIANANADNLTLWTKNVGKVFRLDDLED